MMDYKKAGSLPFESNIVSVLPSKTNGLLFKNTNTADPNVYCLFSGHVLLSTDQVNVTFLTFDNLTLYAKVLSTNVWVDVSVAVVQDPSLLKFPVTTKFDPNAKYEQNQQVGYFLALDQTNNSFANFVLTSIRDPNYRYPPDQTIFFYPESILLGEATGVKGISGTPVISLISDTQKEEFVIAVCSKIVGEAGKSKDDATYAVATKISMIYGYLFNKTYGLIPKFYDAYKANPNILNDTNLLITFTSNFKFTMCNIGFTTYPNKDRVARLNLNLNNEVSGDVLGYRVTSVHKDTYEIFNFLKKDDPNIYYYNNLLDFSEIMNDFYLLKSNVILQTMSFTDRDGNKVTLDLSINSMAPYAVNGEPSSPVTFTYIIYGPSGTDGINLVYGPKKTVTITPVQVDDFGGGKRWTSELPSLFVCTSNRANSIIRGSLYIFDYRSYTPFVINYTKGRNPPNRNNERFKKEVRKKCFAEDTLLCVEREGKSLIIMISELKINDVVKREDQSDVILGICKFENNENMYNLFDVIVSGSHSVLYQGKMIRVEKHPFAKEIQYDEKYIYCIITNSGKIKIGENIFGDYQGDNTLETYEKVVTPVLRDRIFLNNHYFEKEIDYYNTRSLNLYPGFTKDSLIKTQDGIVKAEDLKVGDEISGKKINGIINYNLEGKTFIYKYNVEEQNGMMVGIQIFHNNNDYKVINQDEIQISDKLECIGITIDDSVVKIGDLEMAHFEIVNDELREIVEESLCSYSSPQAELMNDTCHTSYPINEISHSYNSIMVGK